MEEGVGTEIDLRGEGNLYRPEQIISPTTVQPATTEVQPPAAATSGQIAPSPAHEDESTPAQRISAPEAAGPQAGAAVEAPEPPMDNGPIGWTASEFIANQKSSAWYLMLGLAMVAVGIVVWFLTRDIFATVAVLVGVITLGVYAGRQPRQETYSLDSHGLSIGQRHLGYNEFKSFAVVPEGAFLSVELMPLKRLAVPTTIYVDPADEERIIKRLGSYLPMEEAKPNLADSLMRRIKF